VADVFAGLPVRQEHPLRGGHDEQRCREHEEVGEHHGLEDRGRRIEAEEQEAPAGPADLNDCDGEHRYLRHHDPDEGLVERELLGGEPVVPFVSLQLVDRPEDPPRSGEEHGELECDDGTEPVDVARGYGLGRWSVFDGGPVGFAWCHWSGLSEGYDYSTVTSRRQTVTPRNVPRQCAGRTRPGRKPYVAIVRFGGSGNGDPESPSGREFVGTEPCPAACASTRIWRPSFGSATAMVQPRSLSAAARDRPPAGRRRAAAAPSAAARRASRPRGCGSAARSPRSWRPRSGPAGPRPARRSG
jgi:hypothetical protein